MNILLTGSGGFIGKNLKKYLESKYELFTPRSYELDLTQENNVKEYFSNNNIDFIIHCASVGGARGLPDEAGTIENNLAMVNNILKHKKEDVRVILFGSGAMYDKSRSLHKVKEEEIGEFIPKDLYGHSKLLIKELIENRKDVLMLNIFACYGYGEKDNRFPSYAVNKVLAGETIVINQNAIFDYLFVEDMQRIVEYFIQNKTIRNIINITPNKSVSLLEIAQIVNNFAENKVEIKITKDKMNNEYTGDNTRLKTEFPEIKFTQIEYGLKELFNYIKMGGI